MQGGPPSEPAQAPDPLAVRLSASIPRLLTGLAHEPSLGLHVVANHARAAAVPALVGVRRTLDARSKRMRDSAVDAAYAADALQQCQTACLPALASIEALLGGALASAGGGRLAPASPAAVERMGSGN
jgi:hypothetical protein